jgi:hypothetical protein
MPRPTLKSSEMQTSYHRFGGELMKSANDQAPEFDPMDLDSTLTGRQEREEMLDEVYGGVPLPRTL